MVVTISGDNGRGRRASAGTALAMTRIRNEIFGRAKFIAFRCSIFDAAKIELLSDVRWHYHILVVENVLVRCRMIGGERHLVHGVR